MMSSRLTVRRALTLLVASTLLPMLVGGVAITVMQWRSERQAAEAQLASTAQTLVMAVDRELAGAVSRLRAAAASDLIAQRDWAGFQAYANRVLADWPGALMAVTAADGQLVVNTAVPFGTPLPNLWVIESAHRETDWNGRSLPVSSQGMTRRVFATGEPQFSNLYYGVSIQRPTLAAAIPVPTTDGGAVRHALTLSFPPSSLQALIERIAGRPLLRAALVDGNGVVVATNGRAASQLGDRITPPTRTRPVTDPAPDAGSDHHPVAEVRIYGVVGRDGTELLGAYAVSSTNGYTVRVSMPVEAAYAAAQTSARVWGGLALVVLALGVLSSAALAARLRRGLGRLARAAAEPVDAISDGALAGPATVDELDTAARALVAARRTEAQTQAATVARRLAEEQRAATAASEDRLRRVVDSLFAFVGLLDLDGRVIEVNQAPLRVAGLVRADVVGRLFWTCPWWTHDPAVAVTLEQVAHRVAARGEVVRYDVPIRTAGDRRLAIDFQLAPLRDAEGRITHLVASGVDIDARVRATADLRASEERFRALADNISQLAWIADASGAVGWFNRRWYEFTGQDESTATGLGWAAVHHPDHLARVRERFLRALAAGEVWEDTFPLRRHDGAWRWFLSRAVPLRGDDGGPARWFGTNTDITDQLEIERALRRSEERLLAREAALRDADRQKDEFLATLAHELRNPLAPIRTSAELIRMRRPDDPVVAQAAAVIHRQSAQLARLVDDLLDVSRITLGTVTLRTQPLDLRDVVATAVETTRDAVRQARHALALTLPDAPLRVDGDAMRLGQVVANLLQNAAKFTPPGGHLALTLAADGPCAVLAVTDDGCGISPQMIDRVFDLFVQERPSGDAGSSGLGIGLALARRLVEMHGGTITAASGGPGHGSRFEVRLPLLKATPALAAPPAGGVGLAGDPAADGRPGVSVLVVDDNVDAADSLAEVLRMHGHRPTVAHRGAEALDRFARERPRVVVLDIGLPDMSGHEVAARVRREVGSAPSPLLIALTGWGQAHDVERSREAGFDHHLTKPADPDVLVALLDGLHDAAPPAAAGRGVTAPAGSAP